MKTTVLSAPRVDTPSMEVSSVPTTGKEKVERAIAIGSELAARLGLATLDNRKGGGAYWIVENGSSFEVHHVLKKSGFVYKEGRGYWIK